MPRYLIALACCALSSCTTTPAPRPNGPVPLARGSVESFSALVPGSGATPRCERPAGAPIGPDQVAVALVYPGSPEQRVTVTVDRDGVPVRLVDDRGDLSMDERVGDRTTIGLYLTDGYAVLSNRPEGGEPVMLEVPLAEALTSERLGNPRAMLERVMASCTGATTRLGPNA